MVLKQLNRTQTVQRRPFTKGVLLEGQNVHKIMPQLMGLSCPSSQTRSTTLEGHKTLKCRTQNVRTGFKLTQPHSNCPKEAFYKICLLLRAKMSLKPRPNFRDSPLPRPRRGQPRFKDKFKKGKK